MTKGEVLFVIDGKVSDVSQYGTVETKVALIREFLELRHIILTDHPNIDVRIDIRETIQ